MALVGGAAVIFLAAIFLIWAASWRVPALDTIESRKVSQSTKIYDRTGEVLLYDVFQDIKRTVVPFDTISENIKEASLAIEDIDFYNHSGVKPVSFLRAIFVNILNLEFSQGGSTITQQVVKNSLLTGEKKISRKLKEWVLAVKLEKILTKDQIFSMYLNEIPYGGNLYGVEEASQAFFDKSASDVTLAEAAYLAALPKAPTFYSPYGKNRERLETRKNLVLSQMLENKFISRAEYDAAIAEKIEFQPQSPFGIKAPHFVLFVKDQLTEKYGASVLEEGGLKVITTLDYDLQKKVEDIARDYAKENEKNFDAENVAAVAIDPKSGDILTLVGSRDYFDDEIEGNFNVATAARQPGSSFKPFAYAEAFIKGYTPETVVFDLPTEFSTTCNPDGTPRSASSNCYSPVNYDSIFRGPISMREALAQSINVPSVKTLYLAGLKDTLQLAKNMGITTLTDINRYGLTLVLGGGEVSLLDLTSAYSVFANDGNRNEYRSILEIRDQDGDVIEKTDPSPYRVLPEEVARQISSVLSDEDARAPAFSYGSPLNFPGRSVAAKTGTTNDYRDAWVVGYSPNVAVGVWAGNNDNRAMKKQVARYIVAPFWNLVMKEAISKVPDEDFIPPQSTANDYSLKPVLRGEWLGGGSVLIDSISKKRATADTPLELLDEILIGGVHSILYWVNKNDPRGIGPENPDDDSQFSHWEYGVQKWARGRGYDELDEGDIPTEFDDTHGAEYAPRVSITAPNSASSGASYRANDKISVELRASASDRNSISKIDYFLGEEFIGNITNTAGQTSAQGTDSSGNRAASRERSFTFSFVPADLQSFSEGENNLRVVVYDNVQNKTEERVTILVR